MLTSMGERVKRFYDRNLWTKEQVYIVTSVGAITHDEYEIITGEEFLQ